jgi:hypothetical protein
MSHLRRTVPLMQIELGLYVCQWCAHRFPRRHHLGRKPVYCGRTCRQRAYEARRRAALVAGHPRLPPIHRSRAAPAYEGGRNGPLIHALRPDGFPARNGYRQGLCGAWAHAIRPTFGYVRQPDRNSRSCSAIAQRYPPVRAVDPARDVAVLTTLVGRLRPELADLPSAVGHLVEYCWPGG